jgi:hypothetical protein
MQRLLGRASERLNLNAERQKEFTAFITDLPIRAMDTWSRIGGCRRATCLCAAILPCRSCHAEARLHELMSELAHASRLTTMGQSPII